MNSSGQARKKVAGNAAGRAAQSVAFRWRPIEAYLTGRKKRKEVENKEKTNK